MNPSLYKAARWSLVIIVLLLIILTIHETIQAANKKQFNQRVDERVVNLEALAVKNGSLFADNDTKSQINHYMKLINGKTALYGPSGKVVYSTLSDPKHYNLDIQQAVYKKNGPILHHGPEN